jgi:uncharacterized protein YbcC (UPF0753/DUF2309 family)
MRTTLDIDSPVLNELKALQQKEKRSLGKLASELLADALAARSRNASDSSAALSWDCQPMQSQVDLADKDAVYRILDAR